MAVLRLETLCSLIFHLILLGKAQYKDDADYDFLIYDDFSMDNERNAIEWRPEYAEDDFYIVADFTEAGGVDEGKAAFAFEPRDKSLEEDRKTIEKQLGWYEPPDKVYRYTKHRIPGYDYEELDYLGARSFRRCDENSVWTHCLCQFTCADPDVVDCYTPCKSGCECKEDYVYDEKTQRCLLPNQCPGHSSKENFV